MWLKQLKDTAVAIVLITIFVGIVNVVPILTLYVQGD